MKIRKLLLAVGASVILLGSRAVFSEPGSETDPLVTLSYVNKSIEQIKSYIDEKLSIQKNSENELEVVNLAKGQYLIAKAGTEIILRSGKAVAVVSELGGLTDVTAGVDLAKDENVPTNHLLIIPRNDGRGLYCLTETYIMVRGEYEIK